MSEDGVDLRRRRFLTATTAVVGGIGGAFAAVPFVSSLFPSEKAKALGAPVQIDISKIEPGMLHRSEWRGKLIMVVHRTSENLKALVELEDKLADPNSDRETQQPGYANRNLVQLGGALGGSGFGSGPSEGASSSVPGRRFPPQLENLRRRLTHPSNLPVGQSEYYRPPHGEILPTLPFPHRHL